MGVSDVQEPPIFGGRFVGVELWLAPGREQVTDVDGELTGVGPAGHLDQHRLGAEQRLRLDSADQAGQHLAVLDGQRAVDDRVRDGRKLAQRDGGADLPAGVLPPASPSTLSARSASVEHMSEVNCRRRQNPLFHRHFRHRHQRI